MMEKNSRIFVAGGSGLVGTSLVNYLRAEGYRHVLRPSSKSVNLLNYLETKQFYEDARPEYVFMCAAKVGGINANTNKPAEFIYQNLAIQNNTIHLAHLHNVEKFLFLGSSCIYPRLANQPIKEEYLMASPLEETNKPYALAKIAGLTMCEAYNRQYNKTKFISVMPTNLYGPWDNFDLESSHLVPALIRKFHEAKPDKDVILWGTGSPKRELMHVDDLARACLLLMNKYEDSKPINVGTGIDLTIKEIAEIVQKIIGHEGKIVWDNSKPDGTPRKLLDVTKIKNLGWNSEIKLEDGLKKVYNWWNWNIMRSGA